MATLDTGGTDAFITNDGTAVARRAVVVVGASVT